MEHTPGPWRKGKYGSCVVSDCPVPELRGSDAVEHYGGHLIAESIAPQNAPIIAAAPDLLAALRLVHDKVLTEYHARDSYVRQQVEAAIAKATVAEAPEEG